MRPTEPFRKEHEELLAHIDHIGLAARELPGLDPAERRQVIDRVLGFLSGTLLPHAKAEEDVLYPDWARLVGFADAAVTMVHDHEAIVARVERLERTEMDDVDTLQELLLRPPGPDRGALPQGRGHRSSPSSTQPRQSCTARVLERMGALAGHAHEH